MLCPNRIVLIKFRNWESSSWDWHNSQPGLCVLGHFQQKSNLWLQKSDANFCRWGHVYIQFLPPETATIWIISDVWAIRKVKSDIKERQNLITLSSKLSIKRNGYFQKYLNLNEWFVTSKLLYTMNLPRHVVSRKERVTVLKSKTKTVL